jgi:hypothetical protein
MAPGSFKTLTILVIMNPVLLVLPAKLASQPIEWLSTLEGAQEERITTRFSTSTSVL